MPDLSDAPVFDRHVMAVDSDSRAVWKQMLDAVEKNNPKAFFELMPYVDPASWEGLEGRLADFGLTMRDLPRLLSSDTIPGGEK